MQDADDETVVCSTGEISFTVNAADPVAEVDGVGYDSLAHAVESAATGDTVQLLQNTDISESGLTIPADKSLTLDLNGQDITGANNNSFVVYGTLTICDYSETGDGKIHSDKSYADGHQGGIIAVSGEDAELVIQGGTIEAAIEKENYSSDGQFGVTLLNGGDFTMTDGTIKASWYAVSGNGTNNTQNSVIDISGGELTAEENALITKAESNHNIDFSITGGTFSSDVSAYVAANYECNGPDEDGNYTVQPMTDKVVVSGNVDGTTVTGSLSGAISESGTTTVTAPTEDGSVGSGSEATASGLTVNLTTSGGAATTTMLEVNAETAKTLDNASSLTVKTDAAEVSFNSAALDKMGEAASDVTIAVTKNDVSGESSPLASYTVTAKAGDTNLLPYGRADNGTVTITVPQPTGYSAGTTQTWYVTADGVYAEKLNYSETDDKLAIEIRHLSTIVLTNNEPENQAVAQVIDEDGNIKTRVVTVTYSLPLMPPMLGTPSNCCGMCR